MLYFSNLPIVDYGNDKIRDIFKNVIITNYPADDWYDVYTMHDKEPLYDVSLSLYDSVDFWWILAIINNIKDIHYDTYIDDDILQKLAKDTQVLSFNNRQDYLLFPQETSIYYISSGTTISGEVIKKYIANDKYLIDVRLDNIDQKFPDSFVANITSTRLENVSVTNIDEYLLTNSIYRQDFLNDLGYVESFARGYCVDKEVGSGKIFRVSDIEFQNTGATISYNGITLTASQLYQMDYSVEIVSYTISATNIISTFSLTSPDEYENLYLERYDQLEEINNTKRTIKVFKKEFRDSIITQFLNKLK